MGLSSREIAKKGGALNTSQRRVYSTLDKKQQVVYLQLNEKEKIAFYACVSGLKQIKDINNNNKNAYAFSCIATFVGFLSRLAFGSNVYKGDDDHKYYTDFVHQFMPDKYKKKLSGDGCCNKESFDMAECLYSVLRCGLVHALSLCPEIQNDDSEHQISAMRAKEIRNEWIRQHNGQLLKHPILSIFHDRPNNITKKKDDFWFDYNSKTYVLIASELYADVESAIEKLFSKKKKTKEHNAIFDNMAKFVTCQRPIMDEIDIKSNSTIKEM